MWGHPSSFHPKVDNSDFFAFRQFVFGSIMKAFEVTEAKCRSLLFIVQRVHCNLEIITGRNEVLAKVILLHVSVILLTGGGSAPFWGGVCSISSGGVSAPNFGGVSAPNFQGGVSAPYFRGGGGGVCSKCSGGCLLQIFGGVSAPNFRGVSNFRNTVNVRPVRILLECILVVCCICYAEKDTFPNFFFLNQNTKMLL